MIEFGKLRYSCRGFRIFVDSNSNFTKHIGEGTMKKIILLLLVSLFFSFQIYAQQISLSKEQIIELTSEWEGERTPDGRPLSSSRIRDGEIFDPDELIY
jgi:hypothetical protein